MTRLNKIIIYLVLIVILPSSVFIFYQIKTLNNNELMLNELYNNQLDAILFSANQYSEDVVSSLANKIENAHEKGEELQKILQSNPTIERLIIIDTADHYEVFAQNNTYESYNVRDINSIITRNQELVQKLKMYKKGGYRKIDTLRSAHENLQPLIFVLYDQNQKICVLYLDPIKFINQNLSPKLQSIAQERFVISIVGAKDNKLLFSTVENPEFKSRYKKQLWLFPNYNLTISSVGQAIDMLVKRRTYTNIMIIILVFFIMGIGVIIVILNLKKIIALTRQKSDFVSNVSHEIRTPLSVISMFIETLIEKKVKSDTKKEEYYNIIWQEVNRLSGIVDRILSFSKIESGKKEYNFTSLNLNDNVNQLICKYDYHLNQKGFEFKVNLADDLPNIMADSTSITNALTNILDNAIKYSFENKFISITTGVKGNSVFVEIADHGIGIPKDQQEDIFEKFFRVSQGEVHNTKGTGLGLSIVKHIMDAHKGNIIVNSVHDKGSAFKLLFPLKHEKM